VATCTLYNGVDRCEFEQPPEFYFTLSSYYRHYHNITLRYIVNHIGDQATAVPEGIFLGIKLFMNSRFRSYSGVANILADAG
jgi:hypothetical protein